MPTTYGFDGSVDQVAMAKLADYAGCDYAVADYASWRVTPVAGQDRTVQVAAGTGYGHFILDEDMPSLALQLGAITSGKRWDLIARRRTWLPAGGGTSQFVVVPGVAGPDPAAVIPAGRLSGPGAIDDQLVALVQLVAGTPPTIGQVINLRSWPTKVITCETLLALPDADYGAEALVGTPPVRYHRELDQNGVLAWVSPKSSTSTVTTGTTTPETGWVVDNNYLNRCIVDPSGKDIVYELELRRTGTSVSFGASGALSDVIVATLTGPLPDANLGAFNIPVTFRGQGGASTSATSGVYCHGYLRPDGKLYIESGIPNGYITKQGTPGADVWSLQAQIRFRKA